MNETTHTQGEWTPARILNLAEASEVEFAVRVCNAHDDLVAGLRRIAGDGTCFCGDGCDECYPCIARAALAKAGEK